MSVEFIATDRAPKPMGPYSVGVRFSDLVVTAGQLPIDPTTADVVEGDIKEQTRQCVRNLEQVLRAADSSLESVVKLTVFLTNMDDLAAVAQVREEFWSDPHPVSTTVEASRLAHPRAQIEIDVLAVADM